MSMPPGGYETAAKHSRLCARYHAQIEIVARTEGGEVRGSVKRLFRGTGTLRVGDEVRFEIDVVRDGAPVRAGAHHWVSLQEFMAAPYMEVFFDRTRGRCQIASQQYSLITSLTDTPCMHVPTKADVAAAWAKYGGGSMPPCGPSKDEVEEEAVVEMRDQDGGRSSWLSQFPSWLEEMKPGGSLTFVHKDGGQLFVNRSASGLFSVRCSDARGQALAEAPRFAYSQLRKIIQQYIGGDTPEVVSHIRRVSEDADMTAEVPRQVQPPVSKPAAPVPERSDPLLVRLRKWVMRR